MSKAEAERSLEENLTALGMVNASTEPVPSDVHLSPSTEANTHATESISDLSKKT